jgi:hypothetical protein
MKQQDFINLSIEEVKMLNGEHKNEDVTMAWRAGYIFLKEKLEKSFRNDFNDEFMSKIEDIIEQDLDAFE